MEIRRLFDIPPYQAENFPQDDALVAKENGKWRKYSTRETIELIDKSALAFLASGLKPGDKAALVSNNRPEWNFIDIGMLKAGIINVPCYPTISEEDFKFIFNDAEVKVVFVSDEKLFGTISRIASQVPSLKSIYTFNHVSGAVHWSAFLGKADEKLRPELNRIESSIEPSYLATIIYTSGTTGTPKGVMLTHGNIISNVIACTPLLPIDHRHRVISFLPLNHVFERMIIFLYMSRGVSVYYAESMDTIGENIREVKPHLFTAVPRLLEKVYEKIMAKGNELTGVKRKLFFWAVNLGLRFEFGGKNGWWYGLQLKIANKLIFSKWREALGGEVITLVSGSAALQQRLARIFTAGGIPILEGYGLTETSPVIAVNRFEEKDRMFGTVGPVISGVEVKIAADGEILCRGPNITPGYYKRQDLTGEAIDKDGWFHTGDIGEFVAGRFLKITDRKKEIFKTSGGKYVAPQPMENKLKEFNLIEQVIVCGENQKFVSALVTPSVMNLKAFYTEKGITWKGMEEAVANPGVIAAFQEIFDKVNPQFGKAEQVKKFVIIPAEWTVESGELTPTMKLKRKVIQQKYGSAIEGMYVE